MTNVVEWSTNGQHLFKPEESKETAQGFRGTRLWLQSLVCYTFVQQTAAEWDDFAPLFWRTRCLCGGSIGDKERLTVCA